MQWTIEKGQVGETEIDFPGKAGGARTTTLLITHSVESWSIVCSRGLVFWYISFL
jgi:hypothetical protein